MHIGDRVKERRKQLRLTQKDLAKKVTARGGKLSQQQVVSIEAGLVERPRSLPELAAELQVPQEWLLRGEGRPDSGTHHGNANIRKEIIQIAPLVIDGEPIVHYRTVQGVGGITLITKEKVGLVERTEHLRHAKNAFAFTATADDFTPIINPRDVIVVDPDRPLKPGDDCFFCTETGDRIEGMARRLISSTAKHWTVRRYLPRQVDEELSKADFPKAWPIVVIHRV